MGTFNNFRQIIYSSVFFLSFHIVYSFLPIFHLWQNPFHPQVCSWGKYASIV